MIRTMSIPALMLAGLMAFPLAAQTGPTTGFGPPPPPPEPAPVSPPTEGNLEDVVRAVNGDWAIVCAGETDFCTMKQIALNADGTPAAEIEVIRLPRGGPAAAGINVLTPLGVLLTEGLIFEIDDTGTRRYEFQFCSPDGCLARFGVDEASVDAMKRGSVVKLGVSAVNLPEPAVLGVSLAGFTASFNALRPHAQ
jgi:invasion protein IalB